MAGARGGALDVIFGWVRIRVNIQLVKEQVVCGSTKEELEKTPVWTMARAFLVREIGATLNRT